MQRKPYAIGIAGGTQRQVHSGPAPRTRLAPRRVQVLWMDSYFRNQAYPELWVNAKTA